MKARITIWLMCAIAVLAWSGVAGAQTAPPAPKVQLPSGETVWNLSGDWDALIENYGPKVGGGTYPNVFRITQTGSEFKAIRLRDNPPPSVARAGSVSVRGELDKNGFKRVEIVRGTGDPLLSKGQISEDAKKITLDDGFITRMTLTRK